MSFPVLRSIGGGLCKQSSLFRALTSSRCGACTTPNVPEEVFDVTMGSAGEMKVKAGASRLKEDTSCLTSTTASRYSDRTIRYSDYSAGEASPSAPRWMEQTLQYDATKVQQLADVFAGISTSSKEPLVPIDREVELHLRRPESLPRPPLTCSQTPLSSSKPRQRRLSTVKPSVNRNAARGRLSSSQRHPTSSVQTTPSPFVSELMSRLLATDAADARDSLRQLVQIHREFSTNSSDAGVTVGEASTKAVLSVLLSSSRLCNSLERESKSSAIDSGMLCGADPSDTLLTLCIIASLLEASILACERAASRVSLPLCADAQRFSSPSPPKEPVQHPSSEAAEDIHLRRRDCVMEHMDVLRKITHAISNRLLGPPSPLTARLDIILSAIHSLTTAALLCDANMIAIKEEGRISLTADAITSNSAVLVTNLEHLYLEFSKSCASSAAWQQVKGTAPLLKRAALLRSGGTLSLLVKSLHKMKQNTNARPHSKIAPACVQGLQHTMFLGAISLLTAMVRHDTVACDVPNLRAIGIDTTDTCPSPGVPLSAGKIATHLGDDAKVRMAATVEQLWSDVYPGHPLSRMEQVQMHHRTPHTALNVCLASWWKACADTAATVSSLRERQISVKSENPDDRSSPSQYGSLPISSRQRQLWTDQAAVANPSTGSAGHWRKNPQHVELLLLVCHALVEACQTSVSRIAVSMPMKSATGISEGIAATASPVDLSYFIPFYGRVARVVLDVHMEVTVRAALQVGVEPLAPPTPSMPIAKWIESRHRRRSAYLSRGSHHNSTRHGRLMDDRTRQSSSIPASTEEVGDAANSSVPQHVAWGRVYRLCGGVRVAAMELLYMAVVSVCGAVERLSRDTPAGVTRAAASTSVPATLRASALVNSVARVFFAVPRIQLLFGYYSDALYTTEAAEEEARRVFAAYSGIMMWLRELAPPFGVRAGESMNHGAAFSLSNPTISDKSRKDRRTEAWLVCGTSPIMALEGVFFISYYLFHWPSSAARRAERSSSVASAQRISLDATLTWDELSGAAPRTSADALLCVSAAVEYTKEAFFQLQHDTARQLRHLRTLNRLHYFTGELLDKTQLLREPVLRQRHVTSTLAVVQAHHKQPTFLWMPLAQVQELLFVLHQYPQLLHPASSTSAALISPECSGEQRDGDADGGPVVARYWEYPEVHVGDITCTFARLHGYLVKRLYVLGGILREYRSLLLESTPAVRLDTNAALEERPRSDESFTPSFFQQRLMRNATHSPMLEQHRRNNYHWANAWAVQMMEEYPRLASQMEGLPVWASGVLRMLERMETTMREAYVYGLFINVAKVQGRYRQARRASAQENDAASPVSHTQENECAKAEDRNTITSPTEQLELRVQRESEHVPLGVVLDGKACILRIQWTVTQRGAKGSFTDRDSESPFARALAHGIQRWTHREGAMTPERISGWRLIAVDDVPVQSGREVAAQVKGRTVFTLRLEAPLPSRS